MMVLSIDLRMMLQLISHRQSPILHKRIRLQLQVNRLPILQIPHTVDRVVPQAQHGHPHPPIQHTTHPSTEHHTPRATTSNTTTDNVRHILHLIPLRAPQVSLHNQVCMYLLLMK